MPAEIQPHERPSPPTCRSSAFAWFLIAAIGLVVSPAFAQTTQLRLDPSLGGGLVPDVGGVYTLDESVGVRPQGGVDRFHLFETFDLAAGDSVEWVSPFETRNIFNLVTGDASSRIDGLLQSNLDADIYLINPNGILFEENASLDLTGSFIASTADRIDFVGGVSLDLEGVNQSRVAALEVAAFESFGFLGSEESIDIRGANLSVAVDESLEFHAGRSVRVSGAIDDSAATLDAGRLEFHADRGNVRFENAQVTATAGGPAEGSGISIEAQRAIRLRDRARLTTTGDLDSFGISLKANEVTLRDDETRLESVANTANGGAIRIESDTLLSITNGAGILATATGTGQTAEVRLAVENLLMLDGRIETTSTSGVPGQGNIDIEVEQVANLMNSRIASGVPLADSGELRIDAPLLVLQDGSELVADPNEGAIRVTADLVVRSEDSRISAADVSLSGIELIHSLQTDLNERLEILPHDFYGKRVRLEQECAAGSGERKGSLVLDRPPGEPDHPERLLGAVYTGLQSSTSEGAAPPERGLRFGLGKARDATPNEWLARAEHRERNGLLDSALEAASQGIAAAGDGETLAALHAVAGRILAREGDRTSSLAHFESAREIATRSGSEALVAAIDLDVGVAHAYDRNWESALAAFVRAAERGTRAEAREIVSSARVDEASVRIETREFARAREALLEVSAQLDFDDEKQMQIALHGSLVWLRLAAVEPEASSDARQRAVDQLTAVARHAEASGLSRLSSFAWGFLAQVYAEEGFLESAIELTQWAIDAALESPSHGADGVRWQIQLGDLWMSQGQFAKADNAFEIAIHDSGPLGAASEPGLARLGPFDDRADLTPLASRQVDAILHRASQASDDAQRARLLNRALARVESQRVQELQDYFQDPCIAAEHTQSATTVPHTLVVHPIPLEDRLAVIVSSATKITAYSVPVSSQSLFETLRTTSIQLRDRTTNRYLTGSARLYDWLIRPIESEFDGNGIHTLVFVAGPVLRSFPMAALYDRESRTFLVEKIAIASTQGLSLTEPRPLESGDLTVLRAGLTQPSQGEPALRFARKELDDLARLFPGTELVDEAFDRERLEAELEEGSFDIIHIVSHGAFDRETDSGYVLTSNERLGFETLASIIRKTRFRDRPTELITLSACETAVGSEDAALGLAGLSLRAGARSTLATLWRVNDAVTATLMEAFYRHLAEGRVSRAEALRRAQLTVLENPVLRHPAYWAPFTLLGSWL